MDHYEMLRKVSRTFALSIEQLPNILRESVTISYLLLRVADCLEDTAEIPVEQKPGLLRLWTDVLDGQTSVKQLTDRIANLNANDDYEVQVAQSADYILEKMRKLPLEIQHIIVSRVQETSLGMARWQEHGPFVEDESEMDDYMFQVAGLVGYLLTDIFAWYSPIIRKNHKQLMPLAREYGLALQTVNIIRGMRKDYERGWVFIPRTFYERFGLTRDSLFIPANSSQAIKVVNLLADKAEQHLFHGIHYIMAFPCFHHRIRLGCMWPLFFAIKTLSISRNNINVILNETKLERYQVKDIMKKTTMYGWSNRWIKDYYQQLSIPQISATT